MVIEPQQEEAPTMAPAEHDSPTAASAAEPTGALGRLRDALLGEAELRLRAARALDEELAQLAAHQPPRYP